MLEEVLIATVVDVVNGGNDAVLTVVCICCGRSNGDNGKDSRFAGGIIAAASDVIVVDVVIIVVGDAVTIWIILSSSYSHFSTSVVFGYVLMLD